MASADNITDNVNIGFAPVGAEVAKKPCRVCGVSLPLPQLGPGQLCHSCYMGNYNAKQRIDGFASYLSKKFVLRTYHVDRNLNQS